MEAHHTSNQSTYLEVKRSRSPGRLMLRPEVRHIFRTGRPTNFKLRTQTEHEDPHQRQAPWPSRSKPSRKITWCVWQVLAYKSRTKRPRKTKIGRKIVHPTSNNAPQIQGQRSRSPCRLMLRPEVRHIFRTGSPTNFKLGTQTEHKVTWRVW